MNIHQLPVDNTQRTQFLLPVEIPRKQGMHQCNYDQDNPNNFEMKYHYGLNIQSCYLQSKTDMKGVNFFS